MPSKRLTVTQLRSDLNLAAMASRNLHDPWMNKLAIVVERLVEHALAVEEEREAPCTICGSKGEMAIIDAEGDYKECVTCQRGFDEQNRKAR